MLHKTLLQRKETIAIAESCTGGMTSALYTQTPGTSQTLAEAIVTYTNQSKIQRLNIPPDLILQYGAASIQIAQLMAQNVRNTLNADWGIATTGIAGPTGDTPLTPIGCVFFAVAYHDKLWSEKHLFHLSKRTDIQLAAAKYILQKTLELTKIWHPTNDQTELP